MPSSSLVAVTDACVLVPAALCDFLLRAAAADLYRICWSDAILDEVRRTLINDLRVDASRAERRVVAMRSAFPEAQVAGYQPIIQAVPHGVDAKDRHVVAAAIASGAQVIITSNLRDFPAVSLEPLGIEAQSPDDFLQSLATEDIDAVKRVIAEQAAALMTPPMTPGDIVAALRRDAPAFAALIEPML